jgi:hypothetical protein
MAPSPGPQVASTLANRTEISATNSAPGYVAPGLPPAVVPQQSTTPGPRSGPGLASRLGRSLGLATLVFLLGAYGLGYGILGGRFGRFGIAGDEDLPM